MHGAEMTDAKTSPRQIKSKGGASAIRVALTNVCGRAAQGSSIHETIVVAPLATLAKQPTQMDTHATACRIRE